MKTKFIQIWKGWRIDRDKWWRIVVSNILWSITGDLVNKRHSYAFLKWILWICHDKDWSVELLRKLGLFMTPPPAADEHDEDPNEYDGDKELWYPFMPIPDVGQFEIELNAFDPIFAMFGIRKRFSPTIKFKKYENSKYNRYMAKQLQRLEDARTGKVASENDFTSVQLIDVSTKKVIKTFDSVDECVRSISDSPEDVNNIDTTLFYERLFSKEDFLWNGKPVFIKRKFRTRNWFEQTYESKEKVDGKSSAIVTVRRYKPNKLLYFRIVTTLLKYSKVFFLRQVMLTEPRWHREVPYYELMRWWKQYRAIAKQASKYYDMTDWSWEEKEKRNVIPRLKYHRVFIPKPNGKLRPLGVPSLPWRIYLGMWNKFLLKWLSGKIHPHQHAYQPNKGVISVWRDIMENIIDKRNIYSYDLEKYFDKVDLNSAVKTLCDVFEVPWPICYCLGEMHKELPTNYKTYAEMPTIRHTPFQHAGNLMTLSIVGKHLRDTYMNSNLPPVPEDNLEQYLGETDPWIGIPQGGSISPLLAIILQESEFFPKIEKQGASIVKYSDDGLVASDDDKWEPDISVPSQGINDSKEKSFWVKKNGKWKKPLDFCGLRYDGVLDRIIANTRSGSRLELKDVDGLVPLLAFREMISEDEADPKSTKPVSSKSWALAEKRGTTPANILRRQVWGLLQSRLYSGSWELENYEQDFRLTANKGSLVSMHYKQLRLQGVNVFTSTSWAFPVAIKDLSESRRKSLRRWRLKTIKLKNKESSEI